MEIIKLPYEEFDKQRLAFKLNGVYDVDGSFHYYVNGYLHREDGPAIIHRMKDGPDFQIKLHYLNGKYYSYADYYCATNKLEIFI